MKAEINNENKAKFFALYYGQFVFNHPAIADGNRVRLEGRILEKGFLELKPLSSISDEDLFGISFSFPHGVKPDNFTISFSLDSYTNHWRAISSGVVKEGFLRISDFDFLRDRGYLVPWMGLSCEKIIEAGWAKYKE